MVLCAAAACSDDDDAGSGPDSGGEPDGGPPSGVDCTAAAAAVVDCARVADVVAVRQVTHQGGATELDLRLDDACGGTLPASYAECLDVPDGAAVAARTLDAGHTLLLVAAPADAAAHEALLAAVAAFVAARPPAERIAVQLWGDSVGQLADFTTDRARTLALVEGGLLAATPAASPVAAATALALARATVESVSGVADLGLRSVVVLAPGAARPSAVAGPSIVVWVDAAPAELADAAELASGTLDATAAAGTVAVGVCAMDRVTVAVPGAGTAKVFDLIPPLEEAKMGSCDAGAAARGERPALQRVELIFTPAERAIHDANVAALSREEFTVSVRLGPGVDPAPATAHLRGHGSLRCERKSYGVNLVGPEPRHFAPGAAGDEFLLIAMCLDDGYVHQVTANRLLATLDLMPLRSELVELVLDGQSRGVYLLMEKPGEAMIEDHARPRALLRRRTDMKGNEPDLRFVAPGAESSVAAYDDLLATARAHSGEALVTEMSRRMDLDQYLRWVAANSVLLNGDFVDEVWFLATERGGAPGEYFTIAAWDTDGILSSCHNDGLYAMPDPHGILYCAEGLLELALLADPVFYRRFVDHVEAVLAVLTEEAFDASLDATAARLLPFFQDAPIRSASVELWETGPVGGFAEAEAIIQDEIDDLRDDFRARRVILEQRIAAYRSAFP